MFSQLVFGLSCIAVASATNWGSAQPARCAASEAEGYFFGEVVTDDGNQVGSSSIKGKFVSSHSHQVEYAETTIETGPSTTVTVKTWKCYNKGVELEMDASSGNCRIKKNLTGKMFRPCIGTSEAQSVKSFLIGNNKAELLKLAMPDFDSAYLSVLSDSMTPVSLMGSATGGSITTYTALQYANVRSAVSDYSKLTLPASCSALLSSSNGQQTGNNSGVKDFFG